MTWKELKDKISLMTEEEQQQEVAVWGEYLNLMKDCSIECTEEECKLIDSFKRLAKKWKKDGKRLWIYSASGTLHVMMHGDTNYNPTPEFTQYGGSNIENSITIIDGIPNDGGDW